MGIRPESIARNGITFGALHRAFLGWIVYGLEVLITFAARPLSSVSIEDDPGADVALADRPGATIHL